MKKVSRCDLAVEAHEMLAEAQKEEFEVSGVEVEREEVADYIHITRVRVVSPEGEAQLGKEIGKYITVEMPNRFYGQQTIYEEMCKICAKELRSLIAPFLPNSDSSVLVVGLGNWNITADALGPKVIQSLMITRHLKEYIPQEIESGIRPVSAVSPGVLGLTGIETGEIVKGIVDKIKPDLVIAVDALCSRKVERVNTTVQFSDTGITPGEGVGNKRKALNRTTLGVPVIAIGVPTVVDAAVIAGESIERVVKRLGRESEGFSRLWQIFDELSGEERYQLIRESIEPAFGNFILAPKEVDAVIEDLSGVIANGINISLHEGIGLSDIDRYR